MSWVPPVSSLGEARLYIRSPNFKLEVYFQFASFNIKKVMPEYLHLRIKESES